MSHTRRSRYNAYRFPWRTGNRFTLLVDGQRFYPRMLAAIEGARAQVWMEMYLFESGSVAAGFIAALGAAAARGVDVRLLLDDFGALKLGRADRRRLSKAGVKWVVYNPLHVGKWLHNALRDHRKLLVVDNQTAFVGGAGITDDFDPPLHESRRWHDSMVEIRGPVVGDWSALFVDAWNRLTGDRLMPALSTPAPFPDGALGRVSLSAGPRQQDIKRAVLKQVRRAKHRVWWSTAYFIPSHKLRRELRKAAQRGVDVRLLVPGPVTDHPAVRQAGRRFYAHLLRHGVRIFEYQPRFVHHKAMLCDDWVSTGSCNLDRWNLRWNLEANQEVRDQDFAATVAAVIEEDFRQSREYDYNTWLWRSWYARLREHVWGWVDRWQDRFWPR